MDVLFYQQDNQSRSRSRESGGGPGDCGVGHLLAGPYSGDYGEPQQGGGLFPSADGEELFCARVVRASTSARSANLLTFV
eukprot:scaffold263_cov120-Isochrysis_galbana.AAC.6